jgi:hypothetical protein
MLNKLIGYFRSNSIRFSLLFAGVSIAVFDTFVKPLSVIAAGALMIAIIPFVIKFINKFTVFGMDFDLTGLDFEVGKFATDKDIEIEKAKDLRSYTDIDPTLALVGLRIEIERSMRQIAEKAGIESRLGISQMARKLSEKGLISREVFSMISDMSPALNAAAHGVEISRENIDWVRQNGPTVLAALAPKNEP